MAKRERKRLTEGEIGRFEASGWRHWLKERERDRKKEKSGDLRPVAGGIRQEREKEVERRRNRAI